MTQSKYYLPVIGRLDEKLRLNVWPFLHIPAPKKLVDIKESSLTALLTDKQGKLIQKVNLAHALICGDNEKGAERMVRGLIPWHEEFASISFEWEGKEIHKIQRSSASPEIQILTELTGTITGEKEIRWQATHPEEKPMQYVLRYSNNCGKTFERVGDRSSETSVSIDFDQMGGGKECMLQLVATDGINNATAETKTFQVPLKKCEAIILSPLDNSKIFDTHSLFLNGQAFYRDERKDEFEHLYWYSSKDGFLGKGELMQVQLSPGVHTLRLEAGEGDRQGMDSVKVAVYGK